MKNINMAVSENKLTIEVDLSQEGTVSKSGKSVIIASSEGNKAVPGAEEFKIGLNIYKPVN